ncbi:MAG TPA: diaminopimelate epimerase, partial [Bacillota bacterium]
ALENHPLFPNRTNVQFVEVLDRGRVRMLIWERGAGHTLASGSSSCAAAAALHRRGLVDDRVEICMEGGTLAVEVAADGQLTLIGPVEEVCTGQLSADLTARLE